MSRTLLYAAPEVLRKLPVDFKCDIWSLGCLILEVVTGNPAFKSKGDTEGQIKTKIYNEWPEVPQGLDRNLKHLIGRMLCKDRDSRPTAKEICEMDFIKEAFSQTSSIEVVETEDACIKPT